MAETKCVAGVDLSDADYQSLNGGQWLTDTALLFAVKKIQAVYKGETNEGYGSDDVIFLDPLSYSELANLADRHLVESWIDDLDFNDCEVCFIFVNNSLTDPTHWSLLVYLKSKGFFHFNSFSHTCGEYVFLKRKEYDGIRETSIRRTKTNPVFNGNAKIACKIVRNLTMCVKDYEFHEVECPLQKDGYNCGIFALWFIVVLLRLHKNADLKNMSLEEISEHVKNDIRPIVACVEWKNKSHMPREIRKSLQKAMKEESNFDDLIGKILHVRLNSDNTPESSRAYCDYNAINGYDSYQNPDYTNTSVSKNSQTSANLPRNNSTRSDSNFGKKSNSSRKKKKHTPKRKSEEHVKQDANKKISVTGVRTSKIDILKDINCDKPRDVSQNGIEVDLQKPAEEKKFEVIYHKADTFFDTFNITYINCNHAASDVELEKHGHLIVQCTEKSHEGKGGNHYVANSYGNASYETSICGHAHEIGLQLSKPFYIEYTSYQRFGHGSRRSYVLKEIEEIDCSSSPKFMKLESKRFLIVRCSARTHTHRREKIHDITTKSEKHLKVAKLLAPICASAQALGLNPNHPLKVQFFPVKRNRSTFAYSKITAIPELLNPEAISDEIGDELRQNKQKQHHESQFDTTPTDRHTTTPQNNEHYVQINKNEHPPRVQSFCELFDKICILHKDFQISKELLIKIYGLLDSFKGDVEKTIQYLLDDGTIPSTSV